MIDALAPLHPDVATVDPDTYCPRSSPLRGKDGRSNRHTANADIERACMVRALETGECDGMTDPQWDEHVIRAGGLMHVSSRPHRRLLLELGR